MQSMGKVEQRKSFTQSKNEPGENNSETEQPHRHSRKCSNQNEGNFDHNKNNKKSLLTAIFVNHRGQPETTNRY